MAQSPDCALRSGTWCGPQRFGFKGRPLTLQHSSDLFRISTAPTGLYFFETLAERLRAGFAFGVFRSSRKNSSSSQRFRFDLSCSATTNTP